MSFEWVASEKTLDDVIDSVLDGSRYAIDTEFHREKTYYPKLALVQIRWGTQTALIDPLAVDPRRLARLFSSEILAVFHAAQQDLEVLRHASLEAPRNIFDCQVAAGFVGFSTPSLATLVQAVKKTSLSKGDRLTDWLRRPLTDQQCAYAADDVIHLFDLHDELTRQLTELGRIDWVNDACAELASRPTGPQDPSDAWLRLKEVRALKGSARGVAQALAKWREERAMRSDLPPRRVMSDMALLGISQRVPKSVEELANTRGVDDRHLSAEYCKEIMTAVRDGAKISIVLPSTENDDVDKFARPALTLITAWVGELARKHKIDATLLATRSDITAFLRQSPN
ncbi:MAG: ribonuclease D, partial [Ilumatobacteraceae bacterium]